MIWIILPLRSHCGESHSNSIMAVSKAIEVSKKPLELYLLLHCDLRTACEQRLVWSEHIAVDFENKRTTLFTNCTNKSLKNHLNINKTTYLIYSCKRQRSLFKGIKDPWKLLTWKICITSLTSLNNFIN